MLFWRVGKVAETNSTCMENSVAKNVNKTLERKVIRQNLRPVAALESVQHCFEFSIHFSVLLLRMFTPN